MKTASPAPIGIDTLELFSGREKELKELETLFQNFNVVIVEGDFGIGKTSLGNYFRHTGKWLTPTDEISTDFSWDSKDFLHEVIKSILTSALREKNLKHDLKLRPYMVRYNYLLDADLSLKFFEVVQLKKEESIEIYPTVSGLRDDVKKLGEWAKENNLPVLIQLNNLDLTGDESKEKEMLKFFDQNRNFFQIESINWILTGSKGLRDFFERKLLKFGSILIDPLVIDPLSPEEMLESIKKRELDIFEDNHLLELIKIGGDFRSILRKLGNLKNRPVELSLLEIMKPDEKEWDVLETIGAERKSVKDLVQEMGISNKTMSLRVKKMVLSKMLREIKAEGRNGFEYGISFEAYLSMYIKDVKR